MNRRLTAIVERDGDGYVALCPEVDIASQGDSVTQARSNLEEALTLFFETAPSGEVERRDAKRVLCHPRRGCRWLGCGLSPVARSASVLESHGFADVRRRVSHIEIQRMHEGRATTVPVPDHRELRTGTLMSIVRQTGLRRTDFKMTAKGSIGCQSSKPIDTILPEVGDAQSLATPYSPVSHRRARATGVCAGLDAWLSTRATKWLRTTVACRAWILTRAAFFFPVLAR